jgi:protein TonB
MVIKKIIYLGIFTYIVLFTNTHTIAQEEEPIYEVSQNPSTPQGGISAFYTYAEDNIKRPSLAKQQGIKGRVFVQFVVEKNGTLSNIKVLKGTGAGCDEEVIKCLKNAHPAGNPVHKTEKS